MVQTSLNIFDLGVLIIISLSGLLSFFRGFMREVLSLGAWIGASMVTLYTFPTVSEWIEPQVKSPVIASGLASMGMFFIALVVISILTGIVMKFVKTGAEIGFVDNAVGLVFGLTRGILVISIAYFMMTLVLSEKDYPDWVKDAYTRPYVAKSAHWIASLAPDYLEAFLQQAEDVEDRMQEADDALPDTLDQPVKIHRGAGRKSTDEEKALPSFEELQKRLQTE